MGDPKKKRRTYDSPKHPWQADRLEREKDILFKYSLKNKKEVWKMQAVLKKYSGIAKRLANDNSDFGNGQKTELIAKLYKLGLISKTASLDEVLSLTIDDLLKRRLQSIVYNKKLARTMKQARQFIVHGHILIGERRIDSPSYIVPLAEENKVSYSDKSALNDEDHPERFTDEKPSKKEILEPNKKENKEKTKKIKEIKTDKKTEAKKEIKEGKENEAGQ